MLLEDRIDQDVVCMCVFDQLLSDEESDLKSVMTEGIMKKMALKCLLGLFQC